MHPRTVSKTARWTAAAAVTVALLAGTPAALASPTPSTHATAPAGAEEPVRSLVAWAAHWLGTLLGVPPHADYSSVRAAEDEGGETEPPPGSGLVPCNGICTAGGPSSDPNG